MSWGCKFHCAVVFQGYARSGFKTPPTRKPPGTPRHLKDDTGARPITGSKPPRTAPRTGGRRDISSADGPDSVKVRSVDLRQFSVKIIQDSPVAAVEVPCGADIGAGEAVQ